MVRPIERRRMKALERAVAAVNRQTFLLAGDLYAFEAEEKKKVIAAVTRGRQRDRQEEEE